jgi:hypothetical protein
MGKKVRVNFSRRLEYLKNKRIPAYFNPSNNSPGSYAQIRRMAEAEEWNAKEFESPNYHSEAARHWVSIGEIHKAIKNYEKAASLYEKSSSADGVIGKKKAEKARRNADRLRKVKSGEWHGLEGTAKAAAIIGIIGGLLFFSSNLTGNVIGSQDNTNLIGLAFILIGIIGAFFWMKMR